MAQSVYAIATMDTKGQELAFVAECLRAAGVSVTTVDVGVQCAACVAPDVDRGTVASFHPNAEGRIAALAAGDRSPAITAMSEALVGFLRRELDAGRLAGVIGIGGSGGTALITQAMRALPIGLPKVMVSTVASGNTSPYVGSSDITMMYSVVDVAGLNSVSRKVLGNAAAAIAGMVRYPAPTLEGKPTVGMTMFGVTTPCVTMVREPLEARGFDCLVFHATGTGGQAMEKLVEAGLIMGVLDVTTTEVADEVVGGVLPCGPARFDAILESGIPYVLSLGALDMVNFGALESVPERFRGRKLHVHNAQVTLMRTTADENRACARWIAGKLNRARSPFRLLIPEKGVSALDAPGSRSSTRRPTRHFSRSWNRPSRRRLGGRSCDFRYHINDPAFARALVESFLGLQHV